MIIEVEFDQPAVIAAPCFHKETGTPEKLIFEPYFVEKKDSVVFHHVVHPIFMFVIFDSNNIEKGRFAVIQTLIMN